MYLKIVGIALVLFGIVDLVGSYMDFDLWGGFFGVQLPELLWKYSSYIEIGAGAFITTLGSSKEETDTE
ncbi:hypothetical protein [Marinicella sp. W31]|uniref:hypothetical protein n=1 Tax=Marinicella sp. W31 TaxID=3023713 RepID=UPI00375754C8